MCASIPTFTVPHGADRGPPVDRRQACLAGGAQPEKRWTKRCRASRLVDKPACGGTTVRLPYLGARRGRGHRLDAASESNPGSGGDRTPSGREAIPDRSSAGRGQPRLTLKVAGDRCDDAVWFLRAALIRHGFRDRRCDLAMHPSCGGVAGRLCSPPASREADDPAAISSARETLRHGLPCPTSLRTDSAPWQARWFRASVPSSVQPTPARRRR